MKSLLVAGESYEAEQIMKKDNEIRGMTNGQEVFKFTGIRKMDVFSLANGADWDIEQPSPEEEMQKLRLRQDESENAILSLINMSLLGGM